MAPRMKKDEVNAIDKVMENLGTNGVSEELRMQLRADVTEVYADARTTVRRNVRKIVLESMGFDTKYRNGHLGFHGTFDRRDTDLCKQLQTVTKPLIDELAKDIDSRVESKLKITEAEKESLALSLAHDYKQAFSTAFYNYRSKQKKKAEEDFEKLMPFILGSATGANGEELHAEYIMSVIAGDNHEDPKIEIDDELLQQCINEEHEDYGR